MNSAEARSRRLGLFVSSRPRLVRDVIRITGDRSVADDLLQDAWLRFDAAAAGKPLRESFGYLKVIVRNLARDWLRRGKGQALVFGNVTSEIVANVASLEASPEDALIAVDEVRRLRETLAAMPERMCRAVELHRIEGLTLKLIGERLGVSISTAHALVAEGMARIRASLDHSTD